VTAVDTTGAGDLYHAGYIYGTLGGWSLPRRMRFAAAAGALAATELGARGMLPSLEDVQAMVQEIPESAGS
jgi:sugar/nucleoside kinase (ribokinase family)